MELAFGRPPCSLVPLETARPSQLCEPGQGDQKDQLLKTLAQKAYLETRQIRDLRQDLARSLRPTDGPFSPGDHVFYWHQDPSKIKAGEWIRATVVSQKGPMLCLDTGSTVLRVNQSLVRQDQDVWHDVLVPLDENPVSGYVDPDWFKGKDTKCDVLELYSCSARTSEASASTSELVVATPVDLTQPEATSAAWTSLNAARPKVAVVVPRSRPWRKQQPGEEKWQVVKRRR